MGRWQSWFIDYRADPTQSEPRKVKVGNGLTVNALGAYRLTDHITAALTARQFNVSHRLVSSGPPIERRIFLSLTANF